jgi:hypothetical protein
MFKLHMPDQDVVFERKNKLYVAEWSIENMEVNSTIHENKQLYAKEETPG